MLVSVAVLEICSPPPFCQPRSSGALDDSSGKFKDASTHILSGVVMDIAAFKVSHPRCDIDATALRAASSICDIDATALRAARAKLHRGDG